VDCELKSTIDFYFFAGQEHRNMDLYYIISLQPGNHTLRVVVKGENDRNQKVHMYTSLSR